MYECGCNSDMSAHPIGNCFELARAFSLISLLRRITARCPDDLAVIYAHDTDQSGFLSWVHSTEYPTGGKETKVYAHDLDTPASYRWLLNNTEFSIPDSYRKMAKEWMGRCFWDQILNLCDRLMPFGPNSNNSHVDIYGFPSDRIYPAYVRQALASTKIDANGTLEQNGIEIGKLHDDLLMSAMSDDGKNRPELMESDYDSDVLSTEAIRSLFDLVVLLKREIEAYSSSVEMIPTPNARDLICDALEILVCFGSPVRWPRIVRQRIVYEYARQSIDSRVVRNNVRLTTDKFGVSNAYNPDLTTSGKIDTAIGTFQYLSPEAAICTGHNLALDLSSGEFSRITSNTYDDVNWSYPMREFLKQRCSRPIPEVKLFITKEIELQRVMSKRYHNGQEADKCCSCRIFLEPCNGR